MATYTGHGEETLLVPRDRVGVRVPLTELRDILQEVVRRMGYDRATEDQQTSVESFVYGKDVFVCLPTGSEKALCYACLRHVIIVLHVHTSD